MTENSLNITEIRSQEDLQCLTKGDIVDIIYQNEPYTKYGEEDPVLSVYYRESQGVLEFLIPKVSGLYGYIVMYRARISNIALREGAIIINEDKSVAKSFNKSNDDYRTLDETLMIAGLR